MIKLINKQFERLSTSYKFSLSKLVDDSSCNYLLFVVGFFGCAFLFLVPLLNQSTLIGEQERMAIYKFLTAMAVILVALQFLPDSNNRSE